MTMLLILSKFRGTSEDNVPYTIYIPDLHIKRAHIVRPKKLNF